MSTYKKYFFKALAESGVNYIASVPNTAGRGGAVGDAVSMYNTGTASGTPGTDTYATGDFRIPYGMGLFRRNNLKRRRKRKKKK